MVATTIISHIPPSTNTYIGSPSIVALNPLHLIATHDYFGSGSTAHVSGQTEVYESYDGGKSWNHMASITDTFWSSLFLHNNHLYLLGTTKEHGALVIRQSSNGKNWTPPHLIRSGQWHTAPVPVVTWHGRIWRSIEDAHQGQSWPERYRPRYISAALNSNLLDAKSWDISLPYDISSLNKHDLVGVLEGNIVHAESGLALVLRTESLMTPNRGLMIPLQPHKQSYYPARFINLPGGTKKFTIRRDEITKQYITLTNPVTASCIGLHPSHVRNQLSLVSSRDLETWSVHTTLLSHNDAEHHGFQYADWVICDNDILGVVRTAAPYGNELPHNYHDANQLQFFRINNFRALIT